MRISLIVLPTIALICFAGLFISNKGKIGSGSLTSSATPAGQAASPAALGGGDAVFPSPSGIGWRSGRSTACTPPRRNPGRRPELI
jgi:hypothetical protein